MHGSYKTRQSSDTIFVFSNCGIANKSIKWQRANVPKGKEVSVSVFPDSLSINVNVTNTSTIYDKDKL